MIKILKKSKQISEINNLVLNQEKIQIKLNKILHEIPNIALAEVPVGKDEKSNKLIKKLVPPKNLILKLNLM